jgi:sugar transferase (PEP-CTERM/EpsH1 system associated)
MPVPIRIMHIVDNLGKGGLENGLVNLIERLDPNRYEHIVYALRGLGANADRLPRDRVQVKCLGKKDRGSRIQVPALVRAIREVKPDIVHTRNWAAVEGVIAGKWVGSCALVHGEHGLESAATVKEPRRRTWFRRLAYELADRVVSVSCQLRNLHAKRTAFPADRITVIHNGVDSGRYFPAPAARARAREELGLAEAEFCIGCVGNLSPVKDYPTMLAAVGEVAKVRDDWRLVVIGEGPERPKLEALLHAHPDWRGRVSLLGLRHGVPELLNAMDVYVLSSVIEGISNSLLEALATGLAVIATATGGNPEVVVDGECGLLFPVGDFRKLAEHLLLLRVRPDLRRELGQKGLRRVREEFSIESMVRQYEGVYESLMPTARAAEQAMARA